MGSRDHYIICLLKFRSRIGHRKLGTRNMNKLSAFAIFFGLALALPLFVTAQDPDAAARYWSYRARQERAHRARRARLIATHRLNQVKKRSIMPPWIHFKEPNADGDKPLELEDMQLWASMDLDKDGKLTVGEFERFAGSPNAQNFVRQMRSQKAVETWAEKMGIDAEKAKAAMSIGANAQRRRQVAGRQRQAAAIAQRRRAALMGRNRNAAARQARARIQRARYLQNLHRVNPFLARYA